MMSPDKGFAQNSNNRHEIPSRGKGLKYQQKLVGYSRTVIATTAQEDRSYLADHYCSMQGPVLRSAFDIVSLPTTSTAPLSTMMLSSREDVSKLV